MRLNATGIDKFLSDQMLRCGHLFSGEDYLKPAAEFYQFSIDLNPDNRAAMFSLDDASRRLGVLEQLNKVDLDCRLYSSISKCRRSALANSLYGGQQFTQELQVT